jgi:integrase
MKSLTRAELDSLLAVAAKYSTTDALLFLLTFNHGLRVSEVCSLTAKNIADGFLTVQRLKGSKKTTQPLLPNEKEGLLRLAAVRKTGTLFQISRTTVWRRIKQYGVEAGVPEHKLTPHKLKHTTGRLGYEGGMGVPELQKYLGHVNGKNTLVYLEASEEDACQAFAAAAGK